MVGRHLYPGKKNPEDSRPFFNETSKIFKYIKSLNISNSFNILSMGMSSTYNIAIEEGSNLIRLGTVIFGQR